MIEQGSPEWHAERAGKITASRFKDVVAKSKTNGKPLKARADYLIEIVSELLTGESIPGFSGAATAWGTEQEPHAREEYQALTGNLYTLAPFVTHAAIPYVGCSTDSFVGDDGLMEIKCPWNPVNHVNTLMAQAMPVEHIPQVQGQLWVTDRKWCDFVSYDPRMPENLRLFTTRVHRDEAYIQTLASECADLWAEVQATITQIKQLGATV